MHIVIWPGMKCYSQVGCYRYHINYVHMLTGSSKYIALDYESVMLTANCRDVNSKTLLGFKPHSQHRPIKDKELSQRQSHKFRFMLDTYFC